MKTVAIVIYRMGIGGAERLVIEDAGEMIKRGCSVHVMTLGIEKKDSLIASLPEGCTQELVFVSGVLDVAGMWHLAHAFRRIRPDIIMTHLWFANTVGRIAARINGFHARVLAFEHNVYDRVKTRKQFLVDLLLQWWCAKIVAVSQAAKDSLIRNGITASRIAVVPNAVARERFDAAPPSHIRDELGIQGAFTYLYVGRLTNQKAVDILIDAFALQYEGVLVIAGDGEDREALTSRARRCTAAERIFFLGVRQDIPSLMKAADCFVLASRWEGYPMVVIEAMAAGIPIIVSDFPTGLGVFRDDENALVVSREEVATLAEAMRKMRSDELMRRRLVAAAHSTVQQSTIENHVSALFALVKYQL